LAAAASKGVFIFDPSKQGQPLGTMAGEADPDIRTTAAGMQGGGQVKQSDFRLSPMVSFVPALANGKEQTTQVGCIVLLTL